MLFNMNPGNVHISLQLSHQLSDVKLNQLSPKEVNKAQLSERGNMKVGGNKIFKQLLSSLKENSRLHILAYSQSLCEIIHMFI